MRLRPSAVPSLDPVPASADEAFLESEQIELQAQAAVAVEADPLARSADAARMQAAQQQARGRREATAVAERAGGPAPAVATAPRTRQTALGRLSAPGAADPGRSSARIPLQTQVDLSSDSNVFTGFSTNLSEGGLFVATVNLLPVGTQVDLTFTLPGNAKVSVRGEVRWTRELDDRTPEVFPGVGVRFMELSPQAAQVLHRFIAEREPIFYPD